MNIFPEMIDMVDEEKNKHKELERLSIKQLTQKAKELGLSTQTIETKWKNKEASCKIKCTGQNNLSKKSEIISLIYKKMYNPIVTRKSKRKSRKKTTSYDPISPPESPSLRDPPPLPKRRTRTRRSSLKAQKKKKSRMRKHAKHHTPKHIKEMKKAMKRGMSFNKAHKYAMKKVGR